MSALCLQFVELIGEIGKRIGTSNGWHSVSEVRSE
jgi:hypothetical protein